MKTVTIELMTETELQQLRAITSTIEIAREQQNRLLREIATAHGISRDEGVFISTLEDYVVARVYPHYQNAITVTQKADALINKMFNEVPPLKDDVGDGHET